MSVYGNKNGVITSCYPSQPTMTHIYIKINNKLKKVWDRDIKPSFDLNFCTTFKHDAAFFNTDNCMLCIGGTGTTTVKGSVKPRTKQDTITGGYAVHGQAWNAPYGADGTTPPANDKPFSLTYHSVCEYNQTEKALKGRTWNYIHVNQGTMSPITDMSISCTETRNGYHYENHNYSLANNTISLISEMTANYSAILRVQPLIYDEALQLYILPVFWYQPSVTPDPNFEENHPCFATIYTCDKDKNVMTPVHTFALGIYAWMKTPTPYLKSWYDYNHHKYYALNVNNINHQGTALFCLDIQTGNTTIKYLPLPAYNDLHYNDARDVFECYSSTLKNGVYTITLYQSKDFQTWTTVSSFTSANPIVYFHWNINFNCYMFLTKYNLYSVYLDGDCKTGTLSATTYYSKHMFDELKFIFFQPEYNGYILCSDAEKYEDAVIYLGHYSDKSTQTS